MDYCTECGEEIDPHDKFCPNCGTKQEHDVDDINNETESKSSFKFALYAGGGAFVLISVLLLMVGLADSRSTVTMGTWLFLSTLYGLPTGFIVGLFSYGGAKYLK